MLKQTLILTLLFLTGCSTYNVKKTSPDGNLVSVSILKVFTNTRIGKVEVDYGDFKLDVKDYNTIIDKESLQIITETIVKSLILKP